jgi:hypothetical protein
MPTEEKESGARMTRRPFRKISRSALGALSPLMLASVAAADPSPYYLGASLAESSISNVYQTPEGLPISSDHLRTTALQAGFDQMVSRQHLYTNATVSDNRYQRNGNLDNVGYSLSSGVDWETVERLSGHLAYLGNRTLAPFNPGNQPGLTSKNIVTVHDLLASIRLGVAGPCSIETKFEHYDANYSQALYVPYNYRQDSFSLGLLYKVGPSLLLGLAPRETHGVNPQYAFNGTNDVANDYVRHDALFSLNWTPTPINTLDLQVSDGRTQYSQLTHQGSTGLTGSLDWRWQLVPTILLTSSYSRDSGRNTATVASGIYNSANSTLTKRLSLRADYAPTAKLGVSLSVSEVGRDFQDLAQGLLVRNGIVQAVGSDRTHLASLGATWAVTRSLQLGCTYEHDSRSSSAQSIFSTPYANHSLGCSVQGTLR